MGKILGPGGRKDHGQDLRPRRIERSWPKPWGKEEGSITGRILEQGGKIMAKILGQGGRKDHGQGLVARKKNLCPDLEARTEARSWPRSRGKLARSWGRIMGMIMAQILVLAF